MTTRGAGEGSCERRAGDGRESVAVGVVLDGLLHAEAAALGERRHRRLGIRTDGESVQLEGETGDGVGGRDGLGGREEEGLGEGVGRNAFEEGVVFLLPAGHAFDLRSCLPHGHFSEDEGEKRLLPFLGRRRGVGLLTVSPMLSIGERMGQGSTEGRLLSNNDRSETLFFQVLSIHHKEEESKTEGSWRRRTISF